MPKTAGLKYRDQKKKADYFGQRIDNHFNQNPLAQSYNFQEGGPSLISRNASIRTSHNRRFIDSGLSNTYNKVFNDKI